MDSSSPAPARSRSAEADAPVERIRGVVLRVTFENKETGYRVVKLEPEGAIAADRLDSRREVVLVGPLPGIEPGESIEAEGRWMRHPRHGPQFKADWFKPSLPSGAKGIEAYLGSGVLKGVGKVLAARIVAAFGENTFDVLDNEPGRLADVHGISPKKVETLKASWKEARGDRQLVAFLGDHGISPAWAARLRKTYGDAALSIVRSNPYRLAAEVRGVGFMRADAMARRIGLASDAPERIDAALGHVLEAQADDGHTYLVREALLDEACRLLGLDREKVNERLDAMLERKRVTAVDLGQTPAVFLNALYSAETSAAKDLLRIAAARRRVPKIDAERSLALFERRARVELAPRQREAVLQVVRDGLMILTGGPGTGKTTTLRSVIELFESGSLTVKLAAPTGRAARRLSETSKRTAETLHRMLGYQAHTGGFAHDESEPIEADLIVVDETSMVDVPLFSALLRAIGSGTCLLLVGDEDQLPSVGPGNVLRDSIACGAMPVVRLTEVFRQAQESLIVVNAHRVNRGEPPLLTPPPEVAEPDFFFVEREEPEAILDAVRALVAERIPPKFKLDPIRDVQVLTPMRRGELGVHSFNRLLQATLNPPPASRGPSFVARDAGETEEAPEPEAPASATLRRGDRVMQTANDYDKEVFNGDVGIVASADADSGEVVVRFDGRAVSFLPDEARKLALAYATTIHKSQGSEYPAVVIPLHTTHYIMLKRNLLYTAMTRGRRVVCIVGQKRALWKAVREAGGAGRNSALERFVRTLVEGEPLAPAVEEMWRGEE